jgi:hypothetical protein
MAVAAVAVGIDARSARPDAAAGPVVPGLADRISSAQRIRVSSADASYQIERVQRGSERVWVMRDRGDYPVSTGPLAQLTEGLQNLEFTRRMTNDASKHDRLGVGDPRQGGRGVLVQIEDGNRAFLVDVILGVEPNLGLYVRRPNENQTWAARGELPPLRDAAAWMNLQALEIEGDRLARVEITPFEGPAYVLARGEGEEFVIASPRVAARAPLLVSATAERITRLAPADVQSAPSIQGEAAARVRAVTFDGLAVEGELIESDDRVWIKMVARAENPEQEQAALAINARVAEWAFALRRPAAQALAPALSEFTSSGSEE